MFLRKLISSFLILSASIGSSIIVGADVQYMFGVNAKEMDPINCIMLESIGLARSLETPKERLSDWLTDTLAHTTNNAMANSEASKVELDSFRDILEKSDKRALEAECNAQQRAHKAERKAQQTSQRKALRQVTQSFKAQVKPIHQPR